MQMIIQNLKIYLNFFLKLFRISPPIVVPIVPKNKPNNDIFNINKNSFIAIVLSIMEFYEFI